MCIRIGICVSLHKTLYIYWQKANELLWPELRICCCCKITMRNESYATIIIYDSVAGFSYVYKFTSGTAEYDNIYMQLNEYKFEQKKNRIKKFL